KKLIEALLDISRLQNGQLTITSQPLDLAALTHRVVEEIRPMLEQHRIDLLFEGEPLLVNGDELRLEQVLQDLIQNAGKERPMGGTITVHTSVREDWACVTVRDRGIGIPEEALPRLFQRFFRAKNADSQHISGMGVGLYVVKEIMLLHG